MHLHLSKETSQQKHNQLEKILNRMINKIEVDCSEEAFIKKCESFFKNKLSEMDIKLRESFNQNQEVNLEDYNSRRKLWILLYQLFKLNSFTKATWGGKKLQAQEKYMVVKHNLSNSKGWNTQTRKRWRKVHINDCAAICNCSSATPIKVNTLLSKAGATASNYKDINLLYERFEKANIRSRMFSWLIKQEDKESDDLDHIESDDNFITQLIPI